VSELEPSTGLSPKTPSATRAENLMDLPEASAPGEREGLPRNYRMRADAHYVDQLEARHAGPAVRLIGIAHIDAGDLPALTGLEALTQSIAVHGILQPLLVRRDSGRYQLVAGRKRLAAAVAAGLTDVPCIVHHIEEGEAAALAVADNVRGLVARDDLQPFAYGPGVGRILDSLAIELAGIGAAAALMKPASTPALRNRVSADLIQAQAWRAAWLIAVTAAARPNRVSRARSLGAILDRVKAGFEAEARLISLRIECSAAPTAAAASLDEELGVTLVSAGVLASLAWLEGVDEPRVDVRALAPNQRTVRIEIVQRLVPAPADVEEWFRDPDFVPPGDQMTPLAVHAVKTLARQLGGVAEFTPISGRGTIIQATFARPDSN
jgi:ParB-like nuclease family protein